MAGSCGGCGRVPDGEECVVDSCCCCCCDADGTKEETGVVDDDPEIRAVGGMSTVALSS